VTFLRFERSSPINIRRRDMIAPGRALDLPGFRGEILNKSDSWIRCAFPQFFFPRCQVLLPALLATCALSCAASLHAQTGGATVAPASVSFGNQQVLATSAPQVVTLTNGTAAAIAITAIQISSPLDPTDFVPANNCPVAPATLAANASCQISITFTPGGVGPKSSGLTISSNAPGGTPIVPLTGIGIAGLLQLNPGNLKTIAGNGTAGYAGDGGAASAAELNTPDGVAFDTQGNLYIADSGNNVIRKVDTTGIITTVAGNGTFGFSGDGGPATSAQLADPFGVTVDAAGNLYIMDSLNARVRKVDTIGVITTFAGNGTFGFSGDGGPAIDAEVSLVQGARFDSAGNLYVPQCGFDAIRKIDTAGIITTVAGNGTTGFGGNGGPATSAQLNCPSGVTIDAAGDFFIADAFNNWIREVNAQGVISTIAGIGTAGYSGDNGPAIAAAVSVPNDVVVDSAGDVDIADVGNNRLRQINTAGIIATVAGGLNNPGSAGVNSPDAVTLDSAGNLYFCDAGNNAVRELSPAAPPAFPATPINTAATPLVLTLGNIGNLPITVTPAGFTLSGDTSDFALSGGTCLTGTGVLPANGGTCKLHVMFTPTASGIRSVTVSVTSDGVNSPLSFQIAGTGEPLAQTISFPQIANVTYGVAAFTPVATATSALPVTIAVQSGPATVANNLLTITGAGTVTVVASQPGSTVYAPATPVVQSFSVGQAALTVAASNISLPFNAAIPALTYSATGFVNGDTSAVLTGTPLETTTATQGSPAGSYPITISQGTLAAANYSFQFVNGTLTIDAALQFIPVTPCRVADTRLAPGPFGGPALAAGAAREFDIPQSACNIPSTAVAYSLNATVVPNGKLGFLTLWPTGQMQPVTSTLNSDGRVKANAAIVPAGANGGVSVYATNSTHFILDIDGYFVPAGTASALAFYPVTPCRVVDTRSAAGPLGGPFIRGGTNRSFPVQSSSCGLPATAQAYSLNITAVPQGALGYLSAWPTGQSQPVVSTLNAPTGEVTANAAIVPAGNGGDISVFVSNSANVIVDVNGYFAPPGTGGLSLYTTTPCRALDTRLSSGAFTGVLFVPIENSPCALPNAAQAYVLNATVVPETTLGFLTLWPQGENQPPVSALNASDGATTSNLAIVPNVNGTLQAYATDKTNLIIDISSYFAP
jgi:MBG domain (YGX type)